MRIWLGVVLAVVLGSAVGVATAWLRIAWYPWSGGPAGPGAPAAGEAGPLTQDNPAPKVAVDKETFDFGTMDSGASREHEFVFSNVGTAPLKLNKGASTCKCTVALMENTEIPPGGSTKVKIQWSGKNQAGDFRQNATINTNDPLRPQVTLTIVGRVTAVARAIPSELVFSGISAGEGAKGSVKLYGYLPDQDMKVDGHELSDSSTAQYYQVAITPLASDQLKDEKDAKSGYEVQVTLKPGLPLGPIRQRISVKTNLKDVPKIEIPINGKVTSEFSINGPRWDDEQGILYLGAIDRRDGAEAALTITARGPYCKEVKFEPQEISPSLLQVEIGKTKELAGGSVTQTRLTIRVPKGSPPVDHSGSEQGKLGRVVLGTNHPLSHQLRIYVRFAVED